MATLSEDLAIDFEFAISAESKSELSAIKPRPSKLPHLKARIEKLFVVASKNKIY